MKSLLRYLWVTFTLSILPIRTFAQADLVGFDGQLHGLPSDYFYVSPASAAAGQVVQVSFYIWNIGNAASGAYNVGFYLSKGSQINLSNYDYFGSIPQAPLNPNYFQGETVSIQLPTQNEINSLGGAGTFWIGMSIAGVIQTTGLYSNGNSVTITIPPPDLAGQSFAITNGPVFWGASTSYTLTITNLTGGNAGPFYTGLYLCTNSTITTNGWLLGDLTNGVGLPGLNGTTWNGQISLPAANVFGNNATNYYIGMVIDPDNQVNEVTKTNNSNLGKGIDRDPITILNPEPQISVTTSTPTNTVMVAFGDVANDGPGNAVGTQTITIVNLGPAPLNISNIVLTGSSEFSIVQIASTIQSLVTVSSLPRPIAANGNESWVITLQFDPTASTATNGTLAITSNDPNTPTLAIPLTGTGMPIPKISLVSGVAGATNFGNVVDDGHGDYKDTTTISFENIGSGPLTVNQNGISLLNGVNFSVVSITSSTQGSINLSSGQASIAPGGAEIWNVVVQFDPLSLGVLNDGLQVASSDPNQPDFVAPLQGTGVSPMQLEILNASGTSNINTVPFPAIDATGTNALVTTNILLINYGQAPLAISQNGITLSNSANFLLEGIVSSSNGIISLTNGPVTIAGNSNEIWTVTLAFAPTNSGPLTNALYIQSNDPTNSLAKIALFGQGLSRPHLSVSDSVPPTNDLAVPFGIVLNDNGGNSVTQTVTLVNLGTQPLVIGQNGISLAGSSEFSLGNIISSTRGTVNLASANSAVRTIAPAQAEMWTVMLIFDPVANGPVASMLSIASNDTNQPLVQVSLSGSGETPSLSLTAPAIALDVPAGLVYNFSWQYSAPDTNATISLYLTNRASGLIPIATGIPANSADDEYSWRASQALIGTNYGVYATISDGPVTEGSFAFGSLRIDPLGSFQLQSSSEVTSPNYAYIYLSGGQLFQGLTQLAPGNNTLTVSNALPGAGYSTFQFNVNLVSSLVQTQSQQYNSLNQPVQTVNGNGIVTTYTYNQMGYLVQRSSSNGALVTYTYDVLGHRTSMTDYTGTTYYQWDDLGRMTAVITSRSSILGAADNLTISYGYDLAGNRTNIVYPNGETIQYTYDGADRMLSADNVTRGLLFSYTYNGTNGLPTSLTRPNGITTFYYYDGMGNITGIHHQQSNGTLVADYAYELDAAGKATNFVMTLPGSIVKREAYTYDALDRLVQAVYAPNGVISPNSLTVNYTYDGNGDRLTMTIVSNSMVIQTLTYQYGNENRLMSITDQNGVVQAQYDYDAAGNCIQRVTPQKTTLYSYDEENLLTTVVDGTNQIIYTYNGDGQRISKTVNGVLTTFVEDPGQQNYQTVEELNGVGNVAESYTYGTSRLGSFPGNASNFELSDRLDSVRLVTDGSGNILDSYSYDAFGTATVLTGGQSNYEFDGERLDPETGLILLRARYYDPAVGRFITKDPLGIGGGLNNYTFSKDDSIDYADPSGLLTSDYAGDVLKNTLSGIFELPLEIYDVAQLSYSLLSGNTVTVQSALAKADVAQLASGSSVQQTIELTAAQAALNGATGGAYGVARNDITLYNEFQQGQISIDQLDQGMTEVAADASANVLVNNFQENVQGYIPGQAAAAQNDWNGFQASTSGIYSGPGNRAAAASDYTFLQNGGDLLAGVPDYVNPVPTEPSQEVGGVLLDQAATLVGANLNELTGAMYDPKSDQFVFLGTNGPEPVQVDLDYLYTAFQAVYGSAIPPFVTLDPSATPYTQWTDYGNGDGIFEPNENNGFIVKYSPLWTNQDSTVEVIINAESGGVPSQWIAQFNCVLGANPAVGNWQAMRMVFSSWSSPPPAGLTLNLFPFGLHTFSGYCAAVNNTPEMLIPFTMFNGSSNNYIITSVQVIPARQQREYGGRVEGTKLGWVMMEADRVMKCLAIGRDNLLTNIAYSSQTVPVPGYQNMAERFSASGSQGSDIRFWFTPNQMTLQQDIDPTNGQATVVFSSASVILNTESYIEGLPQPPQAEAFAGNFTTNYNTFASMSFPCVDPNDPAGTNIVYEPIFKMLQDVMKAVSLARFCRDNDVPVDMWWLNSWKPPVAYSQKSVPTAYDQTNGLLIFGGVQIYTPNVYVPSASAQDVAELVDSSRPDTNSSDIPQQVWTAPNTPAGTLTAVAASTSDQPQDGNIRLAEQDLTFASPGAMPLQFARYYDSAWLGSQNMGSGWRYTPFVMEFQRPSWYDQTGLMFDTNGLPIQTDSNYDTRLRSGAIRVVDLRTGDTLDFNSSLVLDYAVNNTGNPIISLSGLTTNDLPIFTPGLRQDGAALVQEPNQLSYLFTTPDGTQILFDNNGNLLGSQDRYGMTQTYNYSANGVLSNIVDAAGQTLVMAYDPTTNYIISVIGPANETIQYGYTNGCLVTATHVRSGATMSYQYNTNGQLVAKTYFNGINAFQSQPDLKGRPGVATDSRGNAYQKSYTQNADGSVFTTQIVDPLDTTPGLGPTQRQFDQNGRLLASQDTTGATTQYGYAGTSLAPNYVNLPIPHRPTITIQRNAYGHATQINDPGNIGAQNLTATYDAVTSQLTQFSDAAGHGMGLFYNTNHSVMRIHRLHGSQNADIGFHYDSTGALIAMTNELGKISATYQRDYLERATNIVDATGVASGCDYDSLGRPYRIHDPRLSAPIQYYYNNFDHVTNIVYPSGSVSYAYDPVKGWLVSKTDILGRTTTYVRDPNTGDILQSIISIGGSNLVTTMTYNRFGELASVTPPGANTVTFNYDGMGRSLGNSDTNIYPPGAPIGLQCNKAANGVPTTVTNFIFSWGAPYSDNGIAGYSYGLDQLPNTNAITITPTAAWNNVSIGSHNFSVMAEDNNGLWGPPAQFKLVVMAPPPVLGIKLSGRGVVLWWPTNPAGFSPISTTNLAPPIIWNPVSNIPSIFGTNFYITNPIFGQKTFFELTN